MTLPICTNECDTGPCVCGSRAAAVYRDNLAKMPGRTPAPTEPKENTVSDIDAACEVMHDAYEKAATSAGWETNPASRKPWADVPQANQQTMRHAVAALVVWLANEMDEDTTATDRLLVEAEEWWSRG